MIPPFLLILGSRIHFGGHFCYLVTINRVVTKFKMAAIGHKKKIADFKIDIETCIIPLFLLILGSSIHFWCHFCDLVSTNGVNGGFYKVVSSFANKSDIEK